MPGPGLSPQPTNRGQGRRVDNPLLDLAQASGDRVRAVLNVLGESPYFYRTDDVKLFYFLRRHKSEFARFY